MPIFRLSAIPRFGKGLKDLSDRLQAVRKLLHQRVLHSCRNPLPTGPSKPFGNAVILHQLFYLTDRILLVTQALATTEAKGMQV
jgi:hypothetical protein